MVDNRGIHIFRDHVMFNRNNIGSNIRPLFWEKPPKDWLKYNYDGSFMQGGLTTKAGWIVRDEHGAYIGSGQAT